MRSVIITSIKMVVLAVLYAGCAETAVDDHGHEHGPEAFEALSYTVYSDKTELFVEFKPLTVGSRSDFAAHFTILGDHFLPLTSGKVTVSLIVGEDGIRNSAESASSPGIFRLALIPKTAGVGRLVFDIETEGYTDRIVIDEIDVYADEHAAMDDQVVAEVTDEITYLKEQAWKVEFANEPAVRATFSDIIKTTGQLLPAPGDEAVVSASASGFVRLTGNSTIVGSTVARNSPMFTISGGNLAINNLDSRYNEAKANFDKASADFERAKKLVADKIISTADYEQVQNAFVVAEIAFNAISKNSTSSGQSVASPINGFVKSLLVSEGQYVEAGTPLAIVSQNRRLTLQANVSNRHADKLPSIQSANFRPVGSELVYNTAEMDGRRIAYGRSTSSESAFLPITFDMNNAVGLIPGSVVEVYLLSAPKADVLVIPVSALMEEQGTHYVFVQTGGERFQRRDITIGASDGLRVQVLTGIAEGERVVTKGAYQIKLSSASGELPDHGHEH